MNRSWENQYERLKYGGSNAILQADLYKGNTVLLWQQWGLNELYSNQRNCGVMHNKSVQRIATSIKDWTYLGKPVIFMFEW